ncbi:MAG: hypothetical protein AAF664_17895 [Planctomycetota bacterium]
MKLVPRTSGRLSRPVIATTLVFTLIASNLLSLQAQDATIPLQKQSGSPAGGQSDPVVVVSIGSINKLSNDVNYVAGAVGQPNLGAMFGMFSGMFTQGLDRDNPAAIAVLLGDGGAPQPMAFLPTPDISKALKSLEAQLGPSDTLSDGTYVISVGANTVFFKQLDGYAVAASAKPVLELAPTNINALFDGLGNDYDLGFRLRMQQVPADLRNMLIGQIRQGLDQAMRQQGGEGNADVANASIEQLEQLINETDELTFGINIVESERKIVFDGTFKAVAGTKLARMIESQQPAPSRFYSVIDPSSAAYYHAAATVGPEAVEQARKNVDVQLGQIGQVLRTNGVSESDVEFIEKITDEVAELALKTMEGGVFDIGMSVGFEGDGFQMVAGMLVADGAEAARIAQSAAKEVEGKPDAPEFAFNSGEYAGVTLHEVRFEVPESEDELLEIFGGKPVLHIGTGAQTLFVGLGQGGLEKMKQLIDNSTSPSSDERPIGQLQAKLEPFLRYAKSIEPNPVIDAMIQGVSAAGDGGLIRFVSEAEGMDTQSTTFEIHEGLLKAIGAAVMKVQQQQAQMQGGF